MIDSRRVAGDSDIDLEAFLQRSIDPNWLYLANRYVQYTNALCATAEFQQLSDGGNRAFFESLPDDFVRFFENELNPTESIPDDLYPLKQLAQAGPHREFPLRNGIEKNFKVMTDLQEERGDLSFSHALREAYPGAIYYYMAVPYRVRQFSYRTGETRVFRDRRYTTKPTAQAMVFPDFRAGVLGLSASTDAFVAEVVMQVSERVTGFRERRGKT